VLESPVGGGEERWKKADGPDRSLRWWRVRRVARRRLNPPAPWTRSTIWTWTGAPLAHSCLFVVAGACFSLVPMLNLSFPLFPSFFYGLWFVNATNGSLFSTLPNPPVPPDLGGEGTRQGWGQGPFSLPRPGRDMRSGGKSVHFDLASATQPQRVCPPAALRCLLRPFRLPSLGGIS